MEKFIFPKTPLVLLLSLFILALSFLVLNTNVFIGIPQENPFSQSISTVILPHHDLAALQREVTLSNVAARINPKTVILVSPNHFNTGGFSILTTLRTWKLQNAYFEPDKQKIEKLNIPVSDLAFEREHGITNLLSPLRNAFPNAQIIPIIIKNDVTATQLDALAKNLNSVCPSCLFVSSVDFSHYQSASVASLHDLLSLKALSNLDTNLIWQTEVDSAASLYLGLSWAKSHQTEWFNLEANTNSGIMENAPDAESTSYILGWFESGPKNPLNRTTFVAGNNLSNISDKRLVTGTDATIDLNDSHEMGVLCSQKPEFCALNRLLWGPDFYRDILNGLVVTGEITDNQYHLVLTPTDPVTHMAITGDRKLAVVNRIRARLNLPDIKIGNGYDTISIDINK